MRISDIHKSFIILLFASVLCSCVELEDGQTGVGYLEFPSLSVDATIEDAYKTKVIPSGFTFVQPELSKVSVVIVKEGETEAFRTINASTNVTTLPVGKYILKASYSENAFGIPYFTGEEEVEISQNYTTKAAFPISLTNSLVRVTVGDDLAADFTGESVAYSAVVGGKELSYSSACGEWVYVPSGVDITVKLSGTNSVGNAATFTHKLPAPAAKTAYEVTCRKDSNNWPTITIADQQGGAWANRLYITPGATSNNPSIPLDGIRYQVSTSSSDWNSPMTPVLTDGYYVLDGLENGGTYYVRGYVGNIYSNPVAVTVSAALPSGSPVSVVHNYPGNVLTSSTASVDFGLAGHGGILGELYGKGLLVIENVSMTRNNETLRTFASDKSVQDDATTAAGWPYLPQTETYGLAFTHRLKSESSAVPSSVSGVTFSVAPSFSVALGDSYTSYDKYLAKEKDAANDCDPETLYGLGASCTNISETIFGNSNYAKTMTVSLNGTARNITSASSCPVGNISGLAWQEHKVTAELVFDGVTMTDEKSHHITGLPYRANPPKNIDPHKWTDNNQAAVSEVSWNGDHVYLSATSRAPVATSPEFNIPKGIDVSITSKYGLKTLKTNLWVTIIYTQTTYNLSIGSSVIIEETSPEKSDALTVKTQTKGGTFTKTNNQINCTSTYTMAGPSVYVYSVDVLYR